MKALYAAMALLCALAFGHAAEAQADFPLVEAPILVEATDVLLTVQLNDATESEAFATRLAEGVDADMLAIWPLRSVGLICYVFRHRGEDAVALAQRLADDPRVITAEPVRGYGTLDRDYADELVPIQDAFHRLRVPAAHDRTRGAGATIAVIDTGVAVDHPDLAERDLEYRDFVRLDGSQDAERHGTAIAALIGADASNGTGMVGIAPEATLLPLRACWEDQVTGAGRCNSFTIARALNVALIADADIVNLSLGGPPDPLLEQLIQRALDGGRIVVAAGGAELPFPASMPGVIAVSDVERTGQVTAPGRDVLSATPGGGYDFFNGTSISTAHVSGLAALAVAARGGRENVAGDSLAFAGDACAATGADCDD